MSSKDSLGCQISGLNKVTVKETDTCPPSSSTGVDSQDANFPTAINLELPLLQFHVSKVRTCPAEKRESCFLVTCPGKLSVTVCMWNLHPELLCSGLQLAPKGCHGIYGHWCWLNVQPWWKPQNAISAVSPITCFCSATARGWDYI